MCARRKQTVAFDLPLSPLKLKPVPFENEAGKPLAVCTHCNGSGQVGKARKKTFDNSGRINGEEVCDITGSTKLGAGWMKDLLTCRPCKGAGVFVREAL